MVEIEVFGAGIFGLTIAYSCAKRGAKVRVLEKRELGQGSSAGVVGAMAPHTPDNWNDKKQFQFESLIASESYWAEIDALSGLSSGYGRTGRLTVAEDQRVLDLAFEREATAARFWRGKAEWRVIKSGSYPGWEPASPTGHLIHDTLTARMSPRAASKSIATAFQALGGTIETGTITGKGADITVLATGYEGLLDLSDELGRPIGKGVKGQGALFDCNVGDQPQVFAEGMYFVPHADGTLAVGSTTEITWSEGGQVDEQLDQMLARASEIFPPLATAKTLRRWAGVRPRGRKRAPILGRHPARENVFIANGGFRIGFGMAARIGEVMADLMLDGVAYIPDGFSVEANYG